MCDNNLEKKEEILFPSIIFKVNGGLYSINSQYVSTILQLPAHEKLPEAPPEVTGLFSYRNGIVTMLDLRTAFHMPSLEDEFRAFSAMVEDGIQNLTCWVNALEGAALSGGPFLVDRNPGACPFGQWYDRFQSDVDAVNFHVKRVEAPYKRLHKIACDMMEGFQALDSYSDSPELAADLSAFQKEFSEVTRLLEEMKEVYRSAVFHEMVLVLSDESNMGIVVDEVWAVDRLSPVEESQLDVVPRSPFVGGVERSEKIPGIILQVDVDALMNSVSYSYG